MNIVAVFCGGLGFIAGDVEHVHIARGVFTNPICLSAVIAASISLVIQWILIYRGKRIIIRITAAFQVTMILLAIGYMHFPWFVMVKGGENLSLLDMHASANTIDDLGWALVIGSFLILPSLFYLYYSFN